MNARLLAPIVAALAGFAAGALSLSDKSVGAAQSETGLEAGAVKPRGSRAFADDPLGSAKAALLSLNAESDLCELARLGPLLDSLDPAQVAALLDFVARNPNGGGDDRLAWLLGWWLRRDPAAASAWMQPRLAEFAQAGPLGSVFEQTGPGKIVGVWTAAFPEEALAFARAHPRSGLAAALLRGVMSAWSARGHAARFAVLRDFPAGPPRAATLASLLGSWARKDPAAALAAAQDFAAGRERGALLANVLRAWPEGDAATAFEHYRTLGLADPELLSALLKKGGANPAQGAQWLAQLDAAQFAKSAPGFVESWARRDPAAAFAWALENGVRLATTYDYRNHVEHTALGRSTTSSGYTVSPFAVALEEQPKAMLAWLRSLPAGDARARVTEAALRHSRDADQALALFAELPPEARARSATTVATQFSADHATGRRWVESLPAGPAREEAWRGLGIIGAAPDDLPPGPDRDAMLHGRALGMSSTGPEERLALTLEIGDPTRRRDAFDEVMEYFTWNFSGEMADKTRAWLEAADVPEEWKRAWRETE